MCASAEEKWVLGGGGINSGKRHFLSEQHPTLCLHTRINATTPSLHISPPKKHLTLGAQVQVPVSWLLMPFYNLRLHAAPSALLGKALLCSYFYFLQVKNLITKCKAPKVSGHEKETRRLLQKPLPGRGGEARGGEAVVAGRDGHLHKALSLRAPRLRRVITLITQDYVEIVLCCPPRFI